MAINFPYGYDVLMDELSRCGYRLESVKKSQRGSRVVAAEILVSYDTAIHWDRDSCSLWVEGPWQKAQRVERRIRRVVKGGFLRQLLRRPSAVAAILTCLIGLGVSAVVGHKRNATVAPSTSATAPALPPVFSAPR